MVDILQLIVQFLGINCSIVQCYYPNPLETLFYLVLFPSIFVLAFVYAVSQVIFRGGGMPQGIRMLIAVAVYIYIVINGWYNLIIPISNLWILGIIIIGIVWFLIRQMFGGSRTGGSHLPGFGGGRNGGVLKYATERAKEAGGKMGLEKRIDDRLSSMRAILHEIEHPKTGTDVGLLIARYWSVKNETEASIRELEAMVGWPASKAVTSKYWREISDITHNFEKQERKVEKRGETVYRKAA